MAVVARVKASDGPCFYVASDGRVFGGKRPQTAKPTGVKITRKKAHLYFVRDGEVHEQKVKRR